MVMLSNEQLKNLKDFLRKLGYTKEELVQLENLKNILKPHYTKDEMVSFGIESHFETSEKDWIEISKKSWRELIQYLASKPLSQLKHGLSRYRLRTSK